MAEKCTVRIRKIKLASKTEKIIMAYERLVKDQWDDHSFTSSQEAAPEFYDAFKAITEHVAVLCELPQEYIKRLEVYGVNYRYSGEDAVMGATMTAKMELEFSNTPLILNTPFKKSDNGGDFDEKQYLTEECVNALWELERQARLYIDGHRAQISLFAEDTQGAVNAQTSQDSENEPYKVEPLEDMGNVVNFPPAAAGGGLETHISL